MSEDILQIAEERREAKGKGERERYTKLNVEFQRIPRRDEKALFIEQGKEIEENNSLEKTRDVFKKIRDTKGILQASVQFGSVAQSCPTLCDPMNHSTPGLPVHHQLPEFTQTTSIDSVMPSMHLTLCRPLLLLPPIPPSIRAFSNESTLRMRWPKY